MFLLGIRGLYEDNHGVIAKFECRDSRFNTLPKMGRLALKQSIWFWKLTQNEIKPSDIQNDL